jgi:YidC/Oxa1 family membrane protein insertase
VVDVSHRLLIPSLSSLIPLQNQFLVWNLGLPDATYILPIIVVATTWLQQKLIMPVNPDADPKDPSTQMSRQMQIMMPLMIGLFSLQVASGLSIYWIVGNIVGIVQYALLGKVDVRAAFGLKKPAAPALATATSANTSAVVARPTSETMKRKPEAEPAKPEKAGKSKIKTTTTQTFNATPKAKAKKS